jgi:diguanylate cyclase (GGDEF)-like protein/PAS domain S-box-containing protein
MPSNRPRLAIPSVALMTLLIGLVATALLFLAIRGIEQHRLRDQFERRAANRIVAVKLGLDQAVEVLASVNRLFTTMQAVDRAQFHAFTLPLLEANSNIEALAYHRLVPDAERAAFEAARQTDFPGFVITELRDGKLVRAARRPQYRVVDYLEPLQDNRRGLGLDAFSRAEQDQALARACSSGRAAMTGNYRILLGNALQPGFVMLMPVYRPGTTRPDCTRAIGYTTAALSSQALLEQVLGPRGLLNPKEFGISVYADRTANEQNLVFRTGPPLTSLAAPRSAMMTLIDGDSGGVAASFEVAGRPWHIEVWPTAAAAYDNNLGSWLMLVGGTLGSMLAAAYIGVLAARKRSVEQMVEQRTAALRQASQSLQLLEQAVDACVNSIIIVSAAGPEYAIEYVNPAFEKITGYSAAEVAGRSCRILWSDNEAENGFGAILRLARARKEGHALVRGNRKDGSTMWSQACIAPVRGEGGEIAHFVVSHYDVTEKKRYEEELEYSGTHDGLTGLVNRKVLRDRLQQAIAVAGRVRRAVWVVFIDLDRFKFVNDSLGHRAGDEYLRAIATRLSAAVRAGDTVARLGGDEFMLVLAEGAGGQLNSSVLERIMGAVAQPVCIDSQEFFLGCSAGVASYPEDGADPDSLIEFADLAMYRAKERGRNNFQFYLPEMNQRAQERLQLERALRSALERSEFELEYQPQVDLCSGKVVGVEALLRWRHPELGLLPLERFGAVAEETGLMLAIGAWAMDSACAQAALWQQAGLGELRLALKLGARQFNHPDLAARVEQVLRQSGLGPRWLKFELAESLVMQDVARTVEVMDALHRLGVQLAIDDFGTGFSSAASLKRFPVDALKIDESFVREISPLVDDAPISAAIISMAHSLGMRVIAEGVENESQCEFLSRNMCDEIQGAIFSAPLTPAEFETLLREERRLPERLLRIQKRERTLLLVDDEPNILAALKRQLRGGGYRILTAPGGQQGLDLLATEEVDVIVSDQRMPGMTGVDFLRMVKTLYPQTVRLVLSGFTELQSVTDAVNEGAIYKFLTKPWDDTQLRGHIDEAFAHKEMADENRRLDLEVRTANYGLARANRQLGEVLQQQQEQISRDGVSLEIVRELLQHVPQPIIGVDDDGLVAFANLAAQVLFRDRGALLGNPAELFMGELLAALRLAGDGAPCVGELHGAPVEAVAHSMGKDTQSRGKLIVFGASGARGGAPAADNEHKFHKEQT